MSRNDIINTDGTIKWDVIGGFNEQLASNTNKLIGFVTPEMYGYVDGSSNTTANSNAIDQWVSNATSSGVLAKAHNLTLYKNISLKGLPVEITGKVNVGAYSLELGGVSNNLYNPHQHVANVTGTGSNPNVYIRGASTQNITIDFCNGEIAFRMNTTDTFIGYSRFTIGYASKISINNDTGMTGQLWFNENQLFLTRVGSFTMNGTYSHNNNRIYGGCFEGTSSSTFLDIETGSMNYFYDMRFEGNGTVIFGASTSTNTVYCSYQTPNQGAGNVQVTDNGFFNTVRYDIFKDANKVYAGICSALNLSDSHFQCQVNTTNSTLIQPKNVATSQTDTKKVVFESDYFDNPRNLAIIAKINAQTGNGVRLGYNIYDSSFNLLTTFSGKGLYVITNISTGYSLTPNGYWNYADSGMTFFQMVPSPNIVTNDPSKTIAYIKFFLYSTTDTTNVWGDIRVDIYNAKTPMSA